MKHQPGDIMPLVSVHAMEAPLCGDCTSPRQSVDTILLLAQGT